MQRRTLGVKGWGWAAHQHLHPGLQGGDPAPAPCKSVHTEAAKTKLAETERNVNDLRAKPWAGQG